MQVQEKKVFKPHCEPKSAAFEPSQMVRCFPRPDNAERKKKANDKGESGKQVGRRQTGDTLKVNSS